MEPTEVRIRDCACPGEPHPDGDVVYLRPTLDLAGGTQAEMDLLDSIRLYPLPDDPPADLLEKVSGQRASYLRPRWFETFIRHGFAGSNVEGFTVEDLVADYGLARPVADAATDLYSDVVLRPFQNPPKKRSGSGRTGASTRQPSTRTPSRSKSSSQPASVDGASLPA